MERSILSIFSGLKFIIVLFLSNCLGEKERLIWENMFSGEIVFKIDIIFLNKPSSLDSNPMKKFTSGMQGITGLWNIPKISIGNEAERDGRAIVFALCRNEEDIVGFASKVIKFHEINTKGQIWNPLFVLVKAFNSNSTSIPGLTLNFTKLALHSSLYILHTINAKLTSIQEIYAIRNTILSNEIEIHPGFDFLDYFLFHTRRRSNFQQSEVVAIAMDEADYPLSTEFNPNSNELIGGFEVEMMYFFRDALNFSVRVVKGIGFIRPGPNDTLTGYGIQLNRGEGDIAISAGELLEYRMKGPDGLVYLQPIFDAHVKAFFKQPPPSSIRNVFKQAFTMEIWISSIVIWLVILTAIRASIHIRQLGSISNDMDDNIYQESAIWIIGVACQQGWHTSPNASSVKIIFATGLLTGLISYAAYSSALVSMLAVEVVPIRSFNDLVEEKFDIGNDIRIPTSKVYVQDLEESNKIPKLGDERSVDISQNFDKLKETRFALLTIPDSFYPVIHRMNYSDDFLCRTVASVVVSTRPVKSSCILRRGSPLREFFNYKLLLMQERGVKHRMLKHYVMGTSIQCLDSSGAFQMDFGLVDLLTPFFILLTGIALSFPIALIEKFYHSKKRKKSIITIK